MNAEETTPQESAATENAPLNAPADFAGYVKWRKTGELPAEPEPKAPPVAAAEETTPPPAEPAPESGPEETQQEEEEEPPDSEKEPGRAGSRRRRYERLARENEQLKAQLAAVSQPAEGQKPQPPPGKPKLEEFDTLEAYQEALTDWHITQREAKRQAEADAKAAEEAQKKLQTDWESRQKASRKLHQDYDDVIDSVAAPSGPGVGAARLAMLEDDYGPEILYYLAQHPDDLKRIAELSPTSAVREIGRLSAILTPSPAANGNRITAAPKPPPPSTRPGKPGSDSIFDPAVQADFKRYAKARARMKD